MPTFFDENTLTADQVSRWDWAMTEYEKVLGATIEGYLKDNPLSRLMGYEAGHSSSALFSRLLDGKPALKHRPPTAYSYPWYGVIEENMPRHVMVDFDDDGAVYIGQCPWVVKEVIEPQADYRLTYPKWDELGFEWRLRRVRLPASKTESFICCWHDKSKQRITTVAELKEEAAWHVHEKVRKMREAMEVKTNIADTAARDSCEGVSDRMLAVMKSQEADAMRALIQERLAQGRPALPEQSEIDAEIEERYRAYLKPDDSMPHHEEGSDGLLYTFIWQLERVTPREVGTDIYFDHAPHLAVVS